MSRNEDVTTAIWSDPDFDELGPHAKLVYLWSFTNEHNNMAGLYTIGERTMLFETGLTRAQLQAAIAELSEANFLHYVDHTIFVRSRVKQLRTKSPQIARSIAKAVEKLAPDHPQRLAFMRIYAMEDWLQDHLAILMPPEGWQASSHVGPKRRAAVFERDDYRCVDCGTTERLTVDHILPKSAGGSNDMQNLATRCRSCNSRKGVSLPKKPLDTEPLTEVPSEPPTEVPLSGKGLGQGSSAVTTNDARACEIPDGFPDDLKPHLDAVMTVLSSLAERHNAKAVSRLSLASVVMARPRKPLVRSAHDFASWADGKAERRKDVLSGYRNWLDKADDLASVERIGGALIAISGQAPGAGRFSEYDKAAGL